MRTIKRKGVLVVLLLESHALAQTDGKSASALIKELAGWGTLAAMGLTTGCPDASAERAIAQALLKLGAAADPAIDDALSSIEKAGIQPEFSSEWLLYAYAKIAGPRGTVRLSRMVGNSELSFFGAALDRAMALSLGLTSYVSDAHAPPALRMVDGRVYFCRPQEPRDGLDQFIVAWENDDQPLFRRSLGPRANAALDASLRGTSWNDFRAKLWPRTPDANSAVGYRFDVPGRWSEPEETLAERGAAPSTSNLEFETRLTDRSGGDCGKHLIKFTQTGNLAGALMYLVDNASDLPDLLSVISSCALKEK
jgi:hypothetical protein